MTEVRTRTPNERLPKRHLHRTNTTPSAIQIHTIIVLYEYLKNDELEVMCNDEALLREEGSENEDEAKSVSKTEIGRASCRERVCQYV